MYANGLTVFTLLWLILPGLWLAQIPTALSASLVVRVLLLQFIVFAGLGLICKLMPFLIDPRVSF